MTTEYFNPSDFSGWPLVSCFWTLWVYLDIHLWSLLWGKFLEVKRNSSSLMSFPMLTENRNLQNNPPSLWTSPGLPPLSGHLHRESQTHPCIFTFPGLCLCGPASGRKIRSLTSTYTITSLQCVCFFFSILSSFSRPSHMSAPVGQVGGLLWLNRSSSYSCVVKWGYVCLSQ